jgi:WD40 repeat protein
VTSELKFEYQQHKFFSASQPENLNVNVDTNLNNTHHDLFYDNLMGNNSSHSNQNLLNERILPFNTNHNLCQTIAPKSFLQNLKNYEPKQNYIAQDKNIRILPKLPDRVLDAPELSDDFYLSLLDWSQKNVLAIVLGSSLYLWNAETGSNNILTESEENICSINWMNSGDCLAVGLESGAVQLWDTNKNELLRTMNGHSDRVTALSWNEYIISSGSRDSKIFNHDVRIQSHITSTYLGHKYEVCGLKWSPDGTQLASGGGDNKICIWDVNKNSNINALLHEIDHDFNNIPAINEVNDDPEESDLSYNTRSYQNQQTNVNIPSGNNHNSFNMQELRNRINENGLISNNINNQVQTQGYLARHLSSLRTLGMIINFNIFSQSSS